MTEDQRTSDPPVHPLPECLIRLLIDPKQRIQWADDPLPDFLKPTLFDRVLWWFSAVMFGAAALIFSATLTVRMLQ
jgi:hypothetical protein